MPIGLVIFLVMILTIATSCIIIITISIIKGYLQLQELIKSLIKELTSEDSKCRNTD